MPYWLLRLLTMSGVVGFLVGSLMVLDGEGITRAAGILVVLTALVALGFAAQVQQPSLLPLRGRRCPQGG